MKREINNVMRNDINTVLEHVDYLITCKVSNREFNDLCKEYNDVFKLKALAVVFNTMQQIIRGIGLQTREQLFEDPIYWRDYTPARRQEILDNLETYLEQLR